MGDQPQREAKWCFEQSLAQLGGEHSGSDEWVRAMLGRTRVVEELAKSDTGMRHDAPRVYLQRAGRDASEVRSRLEKAEAESRASTADAEAESGADGPDRDASMVP